VIAPTTASFQVVVLGTLAMYWMQLKTTRKETALQVNVAFCFGDILEEISRISTVCIHSFLYKINKTMNEI
jgi:hypothetical protein